MAGDCESVAVFSVVFLVHATELQLAVLKCHRTGMAEKKTPSYTALHVPIRRDIVRVGSLWGGDRESVISMSRLDVAIEKQL